MNTYLIGGIAGIILLLFFFIIIKLANKENGNKK